MEYSELEEREIESMTADESWRRKLITMDGGSCFGASRIFRWS